MYDCMTEDQAPEITMWEHVEDAPEAPTNGLDEIVDWDRLEEKLTKGEIASNQAFYAEVRCQFEAVNAHFSRRRYRTVIEGLFPEFRAMYRALPRNDAFVKAVA